MAIVDVLIKTSATPKIIIRLWCDIKRNLSTMKLSLDFKLKLRSNHLF